MSARHEQLAAWFDIPTDEDGANIGSLKKALVARGVNARGWRLYLDYGDAMFEALGRPWVDADAPFSSGPNAAVFLRLLGACEMDVLPPPALVRSLRDWRIPGERLAEVPPLFLRAAWKACVAADYAGDGSATQLKRFIDEEVTPLAQWFFATQQHRKPEANQLKAGWPTLERLHQEWRLQQIVQREARSPAPAQWPVFVSAVEWEGLRFVSLASDAALLVEGDAMNHCIGGYGDRCRGGMLRAYSVREGKSGIRVATLTVEEMAPGRWKIDAIKGNYNAPVTNRVEEAAAAVMRSLEDAHAMFPSTRAQMFRARSGESTAVVRSPPLVAGNGFEFDLLELPF
jgi:hypothetical protein